LKALTIQKDGVNVYFPAADHRYQILSQIKNNDSRMDIQRIDLVRGKRRRGKSTFLWCVWTHRNPSERRVVNSVWQFAECQLSVTADIDGVSVQRYLGRGYQDVGLDDQG
jgi:hypothetical protein